VYTTQSGAAVSGNWQLDSALLGDYEFACESGRCLKCADAPCSKGCPASVDPHAFIYALSKNVCGDLPSPFFCVLLFPNLKIFFG